MLIFEKLGTSRLKSRKKDRIFSQGDTADAVFYIQEGKVKLTVVSTNGKEAVVAILEHANFFGEGCLAGQAIRMAAANRAGRLQLIRIGKDAMISQAPRRAHLLRAIHSLTSVSQRSHRRGLGGSTL